MHAHVLTADPMSDTMRDPRPARARKPGGFRIGEVFGVEIRVDWSLAIIFALITYNLGAGVFATWHPLWSPTLVWSMALGAAVLFFASVLVHELSHALVGRAQGIVVRRITLFMFGGMAHMENRPETPKAEFWMAIVGPITSVTIGVVSVLAGSLLGADVAELASTDPQAAMASLSPGATLLLWLGPINIVLGVFNMIPGFPLDGGRVLRAALWWLTGDQVRATRWATLGGQAFAWSLMALGVMNLLSGATGNGIWLLLIGWFINGAARSSFDELVLHRALEKVPVSQIMNRRADVVPPEVSVETFVTDHVLGSDQHLYPVVDAGGHLQGVVTLTDLRALPRDRWTLTAVHQIMTPLDEVVSVAPLATADEAIDHLAQRGVDHLPVVDEDHVVGVVGHADILRWVSLSGTQLGR